MKARLLLSAFFALQSLLCAQTPGTPPTAPPPPASDKPKDDEIIRERERTIYVPYEELEKIFADGGKGVFLPYKEFLEMWNQLALKRKRDEAARPPQEGVVSKAEYTGRVENGMMMIDAKITVESFKEGWNTVSLLKNGVLSGIAEADTGKAVLWSREQSCDVILPDKGVYELKLKIHAPIVKEGGRSVMRLTLPHSAVSRFTATVPDKGLEFKVEPVTAFTSRQVDTSTEMSFFSGGGQQTTVTWFKPEAETALTPLVLASSAINTEVRAGSLVTSAAVNLRMLRAPVKSFSFLVPKDQTIQSVTGNDVKDWNIEPAGEKQKLTINPNAPVRDQWAVRIALESPLPKLPADIVVPEIIVEGATQDRGDINIAAETQFDVTPKPDAALVQQTQTAPPAEGLAAAGGYRFIKHPAKLTLAITEARPQIDVDSLTVLTVKRDINRVETTFNYNIRRVGIFEARVALPEGWTGWYVDGLPTDQWSVEKGAAGETLVVKFTRQTAGPAVFSVRAMQQRANPTVESTVPVFLPQDAARYDAKIGVGVPFSLEVNTKSNGDLRLDDVSSVSSVLLLRGTNTYTGSTTINAGVISLNGNVQTMEQVRSKAQAPGAVADTELTLAFRHRGAVKNTATLSFKARDPQVNVEVLTLMEAKEQSLRHTWTLSFNVAYAGTDRFLLAVPAAIAGDVRFADPSVKEIRKNIKATEAQMKSLPDAASYEFWEVILRNERTGAFQLSLSVEKPVAAGADTKIEMLQVHVPGAFQETGQVAVIKDDSLEIRDAKTENLEDIDPKELHGSLARGGVFLAYKYKTLPLKLGLSVVKNAFIPVPQLVVTQCLLTTAVSTDKTQTTEVVYWVKNNARQFLTVKLPDKANLISDIFVNGATQQPMKREGSKDILVRLPTGGNVRNNAFPVRFVYDILGSKLGEKPGWWGSYDIDAPALDDVGVLEAHHQLYLPDGLVYTSFSGPMTPSTADRGWQRVRGMTFLRNVADALIPAFGPRLDAPVEGWHPIAGLPDNQRASLDVQVPRQGRSVKLHRLGPPAKIVASYRSKKVSLTYEALAFILVVLTGLRRWRQPLQRRVGWLCTVGIIAVVSTGLLSAANGRIAQAAVLALGLVVFIWGALAVLGFVRGIGARLVSPASSPPVDAVPPRQTTLRQVVQPAPEPATPPSSLEVPRVEGTDTPETK